MFFKPKVVLIRAWRKMMIKHYCNHCKWEHFINNIKFSDIWNVLCDNCLEHICSINKDEIVDFPQWYDIVWKKVLYEIQCKKENISRRDYVKRL